MQSLNHKCDDYGQRARIGRESGTSIHSGYDDAHRLTSEDWLDVNDAQLCAFAYDYDAAGNRKKKTFNGEVTYYDYNNLNQLTKESILGGDVTYYTWTADGEMATKHEAASWTYYTWDVDESLKKIEAPNVTLENKYNSRMQRVWRSEGGNASDLIYDGQKLVAEASSNSLSRYYLSEGGSVYSPLVSQLGSQHWFQFDALGSTLGLTDGGGGLSDAFRYEAFGTSLGRTGITATSYQHVGRYGYFNEPSVGLEQVWWRWRQSVDGWLSRDQLDRYPMPLRASRYPSPTMSIDPTGLVPVCANSCDETAWLAYAVLFLLPLGALNTVIWTGPVQCIAECLLAGAALEIVVGPIHRRYGCLSASLPSLSCHRSGRQRRFDLSCSSSR
ncbi:MAG: hypothetical protein ACYC63_11590 [Armatimonadota bacterium]